MPRTKTVINKVLYHESFLAILVTTEIKINHVSNYTTQSKLSVQQELLTFVIFVFDLEDIF